MPRPQRMLAARAPAHASLGVPYDRIAAGRCTRRQREARPGQRGRGAERRLWGAVRFRDQVISALEATALPPAPDRSPGSAAMDESEQRSTRDARRSAGAPLISGRLHWRRAHACLGRGPGVRGCTIGSVLAPASVGEQSRSGPAGLHALGQRTLRLCPRSATLAIAARGCGRGRLLALVADREADLLAVDVGVQEFVVEV
jgi:hypothetical protein